MTISEFQAARAPRPDWQDFDKEEIEHGFFGIPWGCSCDEACRLFFWRFGAAHRTHVGLTCDGIHNDGLRVQLKHPEICGMKMDDVHLDFAYSKQTGQPELFSVRARRLSWKHGHSQRHDFSALCQCLRRRYGEPTPFMSERYSHSWIYEARYHYAPPTCTCVSCYFWAGVDLALSKGRSQGESLPGNFGDIQTFGVMVGDVSKNATPAIPGI
jgi:hypothetical protein